MKINDIYFNVDLIQVLIELKNELNANNIDLIRKYKEGPTHIQICCPYHAGGHERKPSAGIRKSDGIFHCFACNEVHSLQEVISYCFGYTDDIVGSFGWQWLLKNFATVQVEERKDVELDFQRSNNYFHGRSGNSNDNSNNKTDIRFVTEEELDKYRYIHPYMYKRGLTDDIIELFDIGYDSATETITFPVKDICGNCLFIARRSVKTKFFNYPEGVEKPLYGLYELHREKFLYENTPIFRNARYASNEAIVNRLSSLVRNGFSEIIICESMLDALSFWTVGKYAVALNGLGNELQFKQLRELPCRKIILATDSDKKGMLARQRIRKKIGNRKLITEYIFPKGRKDANDCTKEELMNLEEIF